MIFTLRNDLQEIEHLEGALEEFADGQELSVPFRHAVHLALEEVATNIISYAWPAGGEHEFCVSLDVAEGRLTVVVEDDGLAFDPLSTPPPDDLDEALEDREIGGLGIFLARHCMDELAYERREGKNVLTLSKAIPR